MRQPPRWPSRYRMGGRKILLKAQGKESGLDYIESRRPDEGSDEWELRLQFLREPPGGLRTTDFWIKTPAGRIDPGLRVVRVSPGDTATSLLVRVSPSDPSRRDQLLLDLSEYRLEISSESMDPFFSEAPFRFSSDGLVAFEEERDEPPELPQPRNIDYLAKDYASFREVMLDRFTEYVPEWEERNPADLGVTIVEALAYAADHLSYFQDAVATEAYIDTCRKRRSVRRHLRLLGYNLHEGCNARAWVHVEVTGESPYHLEAGTQLLTRAGNLPCLLVDSSTEHQKALAQGSLVFETMHDVSLHPDHNRFEIHRWGSDDYVLPRGTTSIVLVGAPGQLREGDVLILEPPDALAPDSGESLDGRRGHPIRLSRPPVPTRDPLGELELTRVFFHEGDALPRSMPVMKAIDDGPPRLRLVARGNIVLADHGQTLEQNLPAMPVRGLLDPAPFCRELTRLVPFDPQIASRQPASALVQRPEVAVPALELVERQGGGELPEPWVPQVDLLRSQPVARHFAVETEHDGSVLFRFGDGQLGRRPAAGAHFKARYREGNGPRGHIGANSLAHLVVDQEAPIQGVRNPLPAEGGESPESLESARLVASHVFRETLNCVTPEDLVRLVEEDPEVLRAAATSRWTGSWKTWFLYVQRQGGQPLSDIEGDLRSHLEPRLLAGWDLEVRPPSLVALDVHLDVVVEPTADPRALSRFLRERLGSGELSDGSHGFFHPDAFTFGQAVYQDGVLDLVMETPGVESAKVVLFRPLGTPDSGRRLHEIIEPSPFEIVALRDQPDAPQLGHLELTMRGGTS